MSWLDKGVKIGAGFGKRGREGKERADEGEMGKGDYSGAWFCGKFADRLKIKAWQKAKQGKARKLPSFLVYTSYSLEKRVWYKTGITQPSSITESGTWTCQSTLASFLSLAFWVFSRISCQKMGLSGFNTF